MSSFSHPGNAFEFKGTYAQEYSNIIECYRELDKMINDFREAYGSPVQEKPDYEPVFDKMEEIGKDLKNLQQRLEPQTNSKLSRELVELSTELSAQTREITWIYLDEPLKAPEKDQIDIN